MRLAKEAGSSVFTSSTLVGGLVLWALYEFANIEVALAHGDGEASRLLAIAAIVAVAALVSSIAGFAFCALAGSAFAYAGLDPVQALQTMVLSSIAIQLYCVWKIRESIRWFSLWPMLAAGAATVPFGVQLLLHVDATLYAIGLGVFLTAYGCYAVFRRDACVMRGDAWRDAVAGALGGFAGGLAGLPGSFVTIWCAMRGWDRLQQRAVYQPYILVMQIVTIACLRWEAVKPMQVAQDVRFVPFALLGAVGGLALFQRMTSKQFRAALSALLIVSGIGLMSRSL